MARNQSWMLSPILGSKFCEIYLRENHNQTMSCYVRRSLLPKPWAGHKGLPTVSFRDPPLSIRRSSFAREFSPHVTWGRQVDLEKSRSRGTPRGRFVSRSARTSPKFYNIEKKKAFDCTMCWCSLRLFCSFSPALLVQMKRILSELFCVLV